MPVRHRQQRANLGSSFRPTASHFISEYDMPSPSSCPYCQEAMPSLELPAHLGECTVRTAVLDAEARLGRVLTEEETAEIRERF